MPTQTSKSSPNGKSKAAPKRKSAPKRTASASPGPARSVVERAVDLPVGAVLEVSDRVTDLLEPFNGRVTAEKQLKSYRTKVSRSVKRSERRGASARRKATTEARKTRSRVEREARNRRRSVESTLKRNRSQVEQRVRKVGEQLAALR